MSDNSLSHYGKKGMKWGVRKDDSGGEGGSSKPVSARKQQNMDIKAARKRVNEGKSVLHRMLNADTFGKPLGGRTVAGILNPTSSKEDLDMASKMTTGQKAVLSVAGGLYVASIVARVSRG